MLTRMRVERRKRRVRKSEKALLNIFIIIERFFGYDLPSIVLSLSVL